MFWLHLSRASWATFDRTSLHAVCSNGAFLRNLFETDQLHLAGFHWRSRYLLEGEVYREIRSGQIFRAIGSTSGSVLGWPLETVTRRLGVQKLYGGNSALLGDLATNCYQLALRNPAWYQVLDYSDFEALPYKILSPYGAFARGMSKTIGVGIILWQDMQARSVLKHAAYQAFKGLRDPDLRPLLRELGLEQAGSMFFMFYFKRVAIRLAEQLRNNNLLPLITPFACPGGTELKLLSL